MSLKQTFINICITFTILAIIDMIFGVINDKDIKTFDTLIRLILCIIAFTSAMLVFRFLKHMSLRIDK